ncbi:hypothetical protein ABZW10_07205 [Kitasatospora sp. NPDC004723]|uniref:hypothetical protein n=1 Tax=Kitasatospora sp. NPDC004723 TaxID=3154288 RepID=UPI0033B012F7
MTVVARPRRTGRGIAITGVLAVLALEAVALGTAPTGLRSVIGGVLFGSSVTGLVLALLLARTGSRTTRTSPTAPAGDNRQFSARRFSA